MAATALTVGTLKSLIADMEAANLITDDTHVVAEPGTGLTIVWPAYDALQVAEATEGGVDGGPFLAICFDASHTHAH